MISRHAPISNRCATQAGNVDRRPEPRRSRSAGNTCASAALHFSRTSCAAPEKSKPKLETALWELVTAGLITADGFDNIRALIDPKRRAGHGKGHNARPRHSAGRWSLLYTSEALDRPRVMESICWTLLKRYGVVFREMVARET